MNDEKLDIAGPAGAIQGALTGGDAGAIAVLCHPHPLYGGSMDDDVLSVAAETLAQVGIGALRFNFRGVGASEGSHDSGVGEVDDLRAVLGWLRDNRPEAEVLLVGYSFGAGVVSRLLAEDGTQGIRQVLLIAPPAGRLPIDEPDGSVPVDVFVGDHDAFADVDVLKAWQHGSIHVLPGADHFFGGHWLALKDAIARALPR